jgi:large subunit ribosomal protein L17
MRHAYSGNQLGRPTNQAKALYRSLLESMIKLGKIKTTKAKALAVRSDLEKIITLGKSDSVSNRRLVSRILGGDRMLNVLFKQVAPAFGDVTSGFTRIIKSGTRFSDTSEMVLFELTRRPVVAEIASTSKPANKEVEPVEDKKLKKWQQRK